MDKEAYITFCRKTLTPEMGPYLADLVIPCNCGKTSGIGRHKWQCTGWALKTMLKAELPEEARAKAVTRHQ